VIRWSPPGPYEIAFSTRQGGVSEGPYASLNLGRLTGDDVERVDENRRRVCAEVGGGLERLALNRQVHSAIVHRAEPGARGEPGDGLWTEEPDLPVLAMTADCLPIALARVDGARPGVAVLHAGWRGLLGGLISEGVRMLGGGVYAALGPAIGPCCYEVGEEVREAFRARGHDTAAMPAGRLDLPRAIRAELERRGVARVWDCGLCSSCHADLFFSHRRDGGRTGRQAGLAWLAS
jgi:hypothetical protein